MTNREQTITEEALEQEVSRQMAIIQKGAHSVINPEDLRAKLTRSLRTGIPLTVKFGLDPSAPDIHLGHAVVLRKLRQIQDLGHQIVIIIGDFTGKIGDPTGKSKGRKALTDQEVLINAQTYQEQVFHILDESKTTLRYNGEWLELLTMNDIIKLPPLSPLPECWSGMISRTAIPTIFRSDSMNFFTRSCRLTTPWPSMQT